MGSPSAISRHVCFPSPGKVCHTTCDFYKSRWYKLQVHLLTLGGLQPVVILLWSSADLCCLYWQVVVVMVPTTVPSESMVFPYAKTSLKNKHVNLNNELGTVRTRQFLQSPFKKNNIARPSSSVLWSQLLWVQRQEDCKFGACLGHSVTTRRTWAT